MAKYYRLSDSSPAYIAALILHPSRQWQYIERNWDANWVKSAKAQMNDFWEKRYKSVSKPILTTSNPPPSCECSTETAYERFL